MEIMTALKEPLFLYGYVKGSLEVGLLVNEII